MISSHVSEKRQAPKAKLAPTKGEKHISYGYIYILNVATPTLAPKLRAYKTTPYFNI